MSLSKHIEEECEELISSTNLSMQLALVCICNESSNGWLWDLFDYAEKNKSEISTGFSLTSFKLGIDKLSSKEIINVYKSSHSNVSNHELAELFMMIGNL